MLNQQQYRAQKILGSGPNLGVRLSYEVELPTRISMRSGPDGLGRMASSGEADGFPPSEISPAGHIRPRQFRSFRWSQRRGAGSGPSSSTFRRVDGRSWVTSVPGRLAYTVLTTGKADSQCHALAETLSRDQWKRGYLLNLIERFLASGSQCSTFYMHMHTAVAVPSSRLSGVSWTQPGVPRTYRWPLLLFSVLIPNSLDRLVILSQILKIRKHPPVPILVSYRGRRMRSSAIGTHLLHEDRHQHFLVVNF